MASKRTPASHVALGGIMAALAVVLMNLGTLIPVATYACPMLCMMLLQMVLRLCGKRMAWAWYGAVALLGLLLAPDKEAALVFLVLGYYPIVKPWFDGRKGSTLWKLGYFSLVMVGLYGVVMKLLGFDQVSAEFAELGKILTGVLLVMGNLVFFLLDRVLGGKIRRRK